MITFNPIFIWRLFFLFFYGYFLLKKVRPQTNLKYCLFLNNSNKDFIKNKLKRKCNVFL